MKKTKKLVPALKELNRLVSDLMSDKEAKWIAEDLHGGPISLQDWEQIKFEAREAIYGRKRRRIKG